MRGLTMRLEDVAVLLAFGVIWLLLTQGDR